MNFDSVLITLDFIIIAILIFTMFAGGLLAAKSGDRSTSGFILHNRKLKGWLAGLSAVSSASNIDSPLHHSRKVRETGISGAWFYWNSILSSILSVFFIGKLWRRARITTLVEFYSIRYSGRASDFARVYQAVYSSLITNTLYIAMGYLGTVKLLKVLFGFPLIVDVGVVSVDPVIVMTVLVVLVSLTYSIISGLNGIVWISIFQYGILMLSSYGLFFIVYRHIGGPEALVSKVSDVTESRDLISLLPESVFLLFFWFVIQPVLSLDPARKVNFRSSLGEVGEQKAIFLTSLAGLSSRRFLFWNTQKQN